MNVLFITNTRFVASPYRDASTRYRCYHQAEALQRAGHVADVASFNELDFRILARYDVIVVLRPTLSRKLEKLLDRCRLLKIRTVADVDDLIFNAEHAPHSPLVANNHASVERARAIFVSHAAAMLRFDEVSVATQRLAEEYQAVAPHQCVYQIQNGLSDFWLEQNRHLLHSSGSTQRMTYLPGNRSHDRDFALMQSTLSEFITSHPRSELLLVGELHIDSDRFPATSLKRTPWVDYAKLPSIIANSWVTIAPLVESPFNRAKSHIKFIESAAFGTPVVCSANDDIARHSVAGLMKVSTHGEWLDALEQLCDPAFHRTCSQTMREYVHDCCLARHTIPELIRRWTSPPQKLIHEPTAALSKAS